MNNKNTKRALFASAMSMLLCVSMLIGSTFAWFTDTASTSVNTIQAGNLDVTIQMSEDNGANWTTAEGKTLNFIKAESVEGEPVLWEPGVTYNLPQLKIVNNGNLALRFKMIINGVRGDMALANVLWVKVNDKYLTKADGSNVTLADLMADPDGVAYGIILPGTANADASGITTVGETAAYTIALHMDENAGNEYQEKKLENMSFTVMATQVEHEFDSFGNEYDKFDPDRLPSAPVIGTGAVTTQPADPDDLDNTDVVNAELTVSTTDKDMTSDEAEDNASVTIPAGALSSSVTNVSVQVEANATTPANIQVKENDKVETYEISLVDQAGEKVEAAEGKSFTVKLNIGKGREGLITLYHNDQVVNGASYDDTTGLLTFETSSFSPFTVVEAYVFKPDTSWYNADATEFTLTTAEELFGFASLVNGGTVIQGKTIKLGADIDLLDLEWTPIYGWNGILNGTTIDGQGHTIKNMKVSSGDSAGFISDNASSLTIKDLTFDGAYVKTTDGNNKYAGVVMGKNYSLVTLEKVAVKNSQVRCTWQSGGLVGFAEDNGPVFINCSISDSFVGGSNCTAGAFFGLGKVDITVNGGSVSNVDLHTDMEAGLVGYLYGKTLTAEGYTITDCTVVSNYPA